MTPFGRSFAKLLTRSELESFEDDIIAYGGSEALLPVENPLTHCPLCGRKFRAGECRVHTGYQDAIEIAKHQLGWELSNYPLRLDPLRRAGWRRAAKLEGRTLAGWIRRVCAQPSKQQRHKRTATVTLMMIRTTRNR